MAKKTRFSKLFQDGPIENLLLTTIKPARQESFCCINATCLYFCALDFRPKGLKVKEGVQWSSFWGLLRTKTYHTKFWSEPKLLYTVLDSESDAKATFELLLWEFPSIGRKVAKHLKNRKTNFDFFCKILSKFFWPKQKFNMRYIRAFF